MSIGYLICNDGLEYSRHITQSTTIDGYTPKNNKCYCYPYCYIELTNVTGENVTLKWENFIANQGEAYFEIYSTLSNSPMITAYPKSYEGLTENYNYAVSIKDFPQVPFKYGVFENWFALHENQLDFSFVKSAITSVIDLLSLKGLGTPYPSMGNGAISAIEQCLMLADKSKTPDTIKGQHKGSFLMQANNYGLYVNKIVAKAEYIEMIDNYFTRYGYLVNTTKSITITNRKSFDYVQTVDCNIQGNIPQEDIDELESIFNNGVTIWHNESTYGDYNVDNSPRTAT